MDETQCLRFDFFLLFQVFEEIFCPVYPEGCEDVALEVTPSYQFAKNPPPLPTEEVSLYQPLMVKPANQLSSKIESSPKENLSVPMKLSNQPRRRKWKPKQKLKKRGRWGSKQNKNAGKTSQTSLHNLANGKVARGHLRKNRKKPTSFSGSVSVDKHKKSKQVGTWTKLVTDQPNVSTLPSPQFKEAKIISTSEDLGSLRKNTKPFKALPELTTRQDPLSREEVKLVTKSVSLSSVSTLEAKTANADSTNQPKFSTPQGRQSNEENGPNRASTLTQLLLSSSSSTTPGPLQPVSPSTIQNQLGKPDNITTAVTEAPSALRSSPQSSTLVVTDIPTTSHKNKNVEGKLINTTDGPAALDTESSRMEVDEITTYKPLKPFDDVEESSGYYEFSSGYYEGSGNYYNYYDVGPDGEESGDTKDLAKAGSNDSSRWPNSDETQLPDENVLKELYSIEKVMKPVGIFSLTLLLMRVKIYLCYEVGSYPEKKRFLSLAIFVSQISKLFCATEIINFSCFIARDILTLQS